MAVNVALALNLLTELLARSGQISAAINKATAEKRDITDAELDVFAKEDDAARARLQDSINKARSEGQR